MSLFMLFACSSLVWASHSLALLPPLPHQSDNVERTQIILHGINFYAGTVALQPASLPVVEEAARMLQKMPSARVQIEKPLDVAGSEESSTRLAEQRARAIRQLLVQYGVERARLEVVGDRSRQPLARNHTETGQATNRRIVLTIREG